MGCEVEPEKRSRGEYVEVFGLQSQTGRLLNRKRGIVIKTNDDTGRIEVCLGPEGKITSLKPENLRLVPNATAEEMQDAKDEAGPALRAERGLGAQPEHDISTSAAPPSPSSAAAHYPPQRERSRSWSPPPEVVRSASVVSQQAASAAMARGLSQDQAEALGSEAAEQLLARAKQQAHLPKQQGGQRASTRSSPRRSAKAASAALGVLRGPKSVQLLEVGDMVRAVGLKGTDKELESNEFKIERIVVLNATKRKYVVSTNRFVIDAQGDPAVEKAHVTIADKNIRLPGDDSVFLDSSEESSSHKKSKKKRAAKRSPSGSFRRKPAKKSKKKRGRSRSSSSSSSSSSNRKAQVRSRASGRETSASAATLSKADKLKKFGFLSGRG